MSLACSGVLPHRKSLPFLLGRLQDLPTALTQIHPLSLRQPQSNHLKGRPAPLGLPAPSPWGLPASLSLPPPSMSLPLAQTS